MKLGSFYKDPIFIITQTNHGVNQAFTAFDFGYLNYDDKGLYGVADMTFKRSWGTGYDGGCEYWIDGCENVYVQIVHFTPKDSRKVAKGEKFGVVPGDHVHVSLNVQGKWQVYLDYADRSCQLFFWSYGQKHFKWTQWDTYTDRQLICYSDVMKDIFTLVVPLDLESTNTVDLNIRKEPTTKSDVIGKLKPKTAFKCNEFVAGEDINNQPIWFRYGTGWVSGEYVKDVGVNSNCEAELKLAKLEIERLNNELSKFQAITFYTKTA